MRRSKSSSPAVVATTTTTTNWIGNSSLGSCSSYSYSPRRSILPRNGGNAGFTWSCDNYDTNNRDYNDGALKQRQHSGALTPDDANARVEAATTAGRSLLNRPKLDHDSFNSRHDMLLQMDATFTASAAETPIRRHSMMTVLKPCLSTSSSTSSMLRQSLTMTPPDASTAAARGKNEEFHNFALANPNSTPATNTTTRHAVSFSHQQVREYEVTLGVNPSVSSGAPLSLGWRYNPKECIISLNDDIISTAGIVHNDENGDDGGKYVEVDTADTEEECDNDEKHESSSSSSSLPVRHHHLCYPPSRGGQSPMQPTTTSPQLSSLSPQQQQLSRRRSLSDLKLSDRERHRRISANPHVSLEELHAVLQSVAQIRLFRKESLMELCDEKRRMVMMTREDTRRKGRDDDTPLRKRVENIRMMRAEERMNGSENWYAIFSEDSTTT